MMRDPFGRTGVIFIIDDDIPVLDSLRLLLETEGLAARGFASGADFLRRAKPRRGDCAIVDVEMPGMSGLDLIETLRARDAALPVILVMSRPSLTARRRAKALGVHAILRKPFDGDDLVQAVRAALADGAAQGG